MRNQKTIIDNSTSALTIRSGLPRPIEVILASIGLLLVAPFLALAAIAIKASSNGPVFFRQKRMGRKGRIFVMYKLRTMRAVEKGPQVTAGDDPRITTVGRFLRKTKLDELPELWNIFKGDMSLIGPRPEVPQYVDLGDPMWRLVLEARPGLTDPMTLRLRNEEELMAQVTGDRERFYIETLSPFKLRGYLNYLQTRSYLTDIQVIWQTVVAVIFPSKAPPPTMEEITNSNCLSPSAPTRGNNLKKYLYALLLYVLLLSVALLVLTIDWPLLMYVYSNHYQERMTAEQSARWAGFAVVAIGSLSAFASAKYYGSRALQIVSWALFASLGVILPIILFDSNSIIAEDSWVRYPTSILLVSSGILMWFISRRYDQGERWPAPQNLIWMVFGTGLIFGGSDEILQIHERIGKVIEITFGVGELFSDLITVFYGLSGMTLVVFSFWLFKKAKISVSQYFGDFFLFGLLLFITATAFDTFDTLTYRLLSYTESILSRYAPGFVESLFVLWHDPILLLNGLEEIFEFEATVFFLLGVLSLIWNQKTLRVEVTLRQKKLVLGISVVVVLALLILPWSAPLVMIAKGLLKRD